MYQGWSRVLEEFLLPLLFLMHDSKVSYPLRYEINLKELKKSHENIIPFMFHDDSLLGLCGDYALFFWIVDIYLLSKH